MLLVRSPPPAAAATGGSGSGSSSPDVAWVTVGSEGEGERVWLSPHEPCARGSGCSAVVGEVALVAPSLGTSQRLLNKDHYKVRAGAAGSCTPSVHFIG